MMNYTFKCENGKTATVRACDMEQARIVAMVRHGKEFMWAKLTAANNRVA